MTLDVSVVIPARDEADAIGGCLAALACQSVGAGALEVIVVAAGGDDTAGAAARAAAGLEFGRFEIVRLGRGNKNVALQAGCARVSAPIVVLLDADTELAPEAIAELAAALGDGAERAVHGAALPRFDTWVSRYWELNRKLVKDLRFDGTLSGEVVALRRTTLVAHDAAVLFPPRVGSQDDLVLGRVLAAHGCGIGYVASARATTLVPWTLGVLAATMLRSRRGLMAVLPADEAARQAAFSAAVVGGVPAALVTAPWSLAVAALCLVPLAVRAGVAARGIALLRARGLGDHRRELPAFLLLDVLGRTLKLWAFVERVLGREAPGTYRGGRPRELGARVASRGMV